MEEYTIISLIPIGVTIAFGISYGFDKIYNEKFINEFKRYKDEISNNLIFSLRKIALTSYEDRTKIEEKVEKFIKEWQDYQENIKEKYNELLNFRKVFMLLFTVGALIYLLSIFMKTKLFDLALEYYATIFYIAGFVVLIKFVVILYDLKSKIAKYELERPSFKDIKEKISRRFKN